MNSETEAEYQEEKYDESQLSLFHVKILRTLCPSKNSPLSEQQGYYNYYCQYYYTDEEEHKIETWTKTIDAVYFNMTKRLVLDQEQLLNILVIEEHNYKAIKQILDILESRKVIVRASKIFNGNYYKQEPKKSSFWGASLFKKAKDLFTGNDEDEENELSQETKNKFVWVSWLNYVSKEIMNHIAFEEITPIITHKKFHEVCVDKFSLNQLEKKVVEKHLHKLNKIKYSKATISFREGTYQKEYKVIRFINLDQLRRNGNASSPSLKDDKNISEFHLMLFELELNQQELKDGLIQVEGRKEFLENNIELIMKEVEADDHDRKDKIKVDIKKLRLFEHVWMKLSQCIALIDEEFPRIKEYKENIPKETIRMFAIETRKDLKDFDEAMHYVESATLDDIPQERIPKWFEGEEEITEEELEEEFKNDFGNESELGDIEQYESIIEKLRANIRTHTQSFYEPNKTLNDSLIHNYDWNEANNIDYNNKLKKELSQNNFHNLRRSMMIVPGDEEESGEEFNHEDMQNILDFSF